MARYVDLVRAHGGLPNLDLPTICTWADIDDAELGNRGPPAIVNHVEPMATRWFLDARSTPARSECAE